METDDIFMSLGYILIPVHAMRAMTWDIPTPTHSVSLFHVYLGVKIETDDIFMSPGHILVHVHTYHTMFLRHTSTFTFCIKTPCISWHQE